MQVQQDNRTKAITFTILLHVILGAILILGIEFSDYRPLSGPKVEIIEAEIVTTVPKATPAPKPIAIPKPRVDPEEERRKQQLEEQQKREVEEARRRQEIEERERRQHAKEQQKQAEEIKRQKAEARTKLKAEQDAKKKAEVAARKQAEETARKIKAEEDTRRKTEAEQQAREQALQEALAQEQRERELNPLRDAYSAAISQQIARNWLKPPGISDDLKCEALVSQLPDGNVTSAKITKSSGNTVFDESVIKAIYKAAPLPQPPSPEVFERELQIAFCSTGNLC